MFVGDWQTLVTLPAPPPLLRLLLHLPLCGEPTRTWAGHHLKFTLLCPPRHHIATFYRTMTRLTSASHVFAKKTLHTIAILQCKIARYDYSRMKHLWLGMMSQLKSRWSHYKVTIMTYLKFAVLDPLIYLNHLSHLPKSHLNHISHRRICPIGPLHASEHHGGWERGWVQEDLQLPLDTQVLGDDGCEILHQLMASG